GGYGGRSGRGGGWGGKGLVDPDLDGLLGGISDEELAVIVSDVGGHDLGAVLDALAEADTDRDRPVVILAHTIKGWGLPFAADPLNHTALLTAAQIEELRGTLGVQPGDEWAAFPADSAEAAWIRALPPLLSSPRTAAPPEIPEQLDEHYPDETSTQEAFGRVLGALARRPAGDAVVTVSADVAVTTHLAGWINRKGLYFPQTRPNFFSDVAQPLPWRRAPQGQPTH